MSAWVASSLRSHREAFPTTATRLQYWRLTRSAGERCARCERCPSSKCVASAASIVSEPNVCLQERAHWPLRVSRVSRRVSYSVRKPSSTSVSSANAVKSQCMDNIYQCFASSRATQGVDNEWSTKRVALFARLVCAPCWCTLLMRLANAPCLQRFICAPCLQRFICAPCLRALFARLVCSALFAALYLRALFARFICALYLRALFARLVCAPCLRALY